MARLLLYRRNNSNEFGETSASQCLNALKEPRFPPFCAVCNAKIISRVYDHQIYVDRDDEIEALQLLPLFFSLSLLPPSARFKKKKKIYRELETVEKESKKRKFSIPTCRVERLPADADMFIRCGEETRGNLSMEGKEREREKKGGNAVIFRPSYP